MKQWNTPWNSPPPPVVYDRESNIKQSDVTVDQAMKDLQHPAVTDPRDERIRALEDGLRGLVKRLELIHANWQVFYVHDGSYERGPSYNKELAAAKALLAAKDKSEP